MSTELDQENSGAAGVPSAEPGRGGRWARLGEMLAMFVLAPTVLALVMRPGMLFPAMWALGGISLWLLLRDPTFERRRLWNAAGVRPALRLILARFVICTPLLALLLWQVKREMMLELVSGRPGLWCLIMVVYPVFSVYPQEVAFRAMFAHRYAWLFRDQRLFVLVSALAFGFAHVVLYNWWAVGLSVIGGVFFMTTYLRTRSLAAACVEHALYGWALFTLGWGWYFYDGANSDRGH